MSDFDEPTLTASLREKALRLAMDMRFQDDTPEIIVAYASTFLEFLETGELT